MSEFTPRVFWGDNGTHRLGWWIDLSPIGKKVEPIWGPAIQATESEVRAAANIGRNAGLWSGPLKFEAAGTSE